MKYINRSHVINLAASFNSTVGKKAVSGAAFAALAAFVAK